MSERVISLRRADAVHPGDWILAQCDGILGPYRVTEASVHDDATEHPHLVSVMLTLVQEGHSRRSGRSIKQMHTEGDFVPMLVPLPEAALDAGCLVFSQRDRAMLRWVLGQRHLDRDLRDWCAEKLSLLAGA